MSLTVEQIYWIYSNQGQFAYGSFKAKTHNGSFIDSRYNFLFTQKALGESLMTQQLNNSC